MVSVSLSISRVFLVKLKTRCFRDLFRTITLSLYDRRDFFMNKPVVHTLDSQLRQVLEWPPGNSTGAVLFGSLAKGTARYDSDREAKRKNLCFT